MTTAARRPENSIGLLRVLLAGAVLWGHSWYLAGREHDEPIARWLLGNGEAIATFAVKGFFVLSGYLVMQSEQRLTSTRRFLWHRLLRIYPGLWACLLVTAFVLPALFGYIAHSEVSWSEGWRYLTANFVLVRAQLGIPNIFEQGFKPGDLNGSLWTLPYELGCYAAIAALGWLGVTRRKTRRPWLVAAAIGALYVHDLLRPDAAVFFKTDGRALAIWFLVGALAACISESTLRTWLGWPAALVSAAIYVAACRFGGLAFVGPFAIAALVLSLAFKLPFYDFEQFVGGDYSYGIYIYGYPVQQAFASAGLVSFGFGHYFANVASLTLLLAVLSWHLIEKRALKLKSFSLPSRAPLRHPAHA